MEFITHFGIALLGVVVYNLWIFRKHLRQPKLLQSKVFWESYFDTSKFIWLWSILFILVISTIVSVSPETADSIKNLTGLDIANSLPAYFTFGIGICSLVDSKPK
jgi:hypothetical protein